LAGELIMTTSVQCKDFSGSSRTPAETETYADAIADSSALILKGSDTGVRPPDTADEEC
jgi:hypothetical protein